MATAFQGLRKTLTEIRRFQDAVERDVTQFKPKRLDALMAKFRDLGEIAFRETFMGLSKQHFPKAKATADIPRLLQLEMLRHINRWNQNLATATAVAKDSIPEYRNPLRVKVPKVGRRTILARLDKELGRGTSEPGLHKKGGRSLYGLAKLNGQRNRKVLTRLYQYLKGLLATAPRNFIRDYKMDLLRLNRTTGTKILVKLSGGVGPNSCSTCTALNGRVLTEDAHKYATEYLNPPLYHPNCRHVAHTGKMQGLTLATYDEKIHGELITLPVLHRMVGAGKLNRGKRRRAFVRT